MRIMHINKFAYPKGGAENYMLRTAEKQFHDGDAVAILGAEVARSGLNSAVKKYNLDVPDYHLLSGLAKVRAAKNVLWSKQAAITVAAALDDFKPDVVHLHNYAHQLSSSILAEISSRGLPAIYTAHDYKLICPAYVANVENKDCFACADKISLKLLRKKCHHDSASWSTVVGLEAAIVRKGRLVPDKIIGPSRFMTDALKSSWLCDFTDIHLLRNPVQHAGVAWVGSGDYLLYVGRLSREKGVARLVEAVAELGIPLKIAGDGPIRPELEELAVGLNASIEFLGHIGQRALAPIRQECLAQVLSSDWPENAPLSALEAAADGVPLIVTARGGLPEFAEIGAKVAVIEDLGCEQLRRALVSLTNLESDIVRFRRETDWQTHIHGLKAIYADSMRGLVEKS